MSIASKGLSAISRLAIVILLLGAFGVGMAGVVYMSLSGTELKVPEIVGKDFYQSEKELAAMGLKIKKRADRASTEPMNAILEQLPKAGETVKTGQMILVVVSKAGIEGEAPPPQLKTTEEDDSEKIEEMISEKPKKAKSNSNTSKKKADTTRDTLTDSNSAVNSNKAAGEPDGDKRDSGTTPAGDKNDKETKPVSKPPASPGPVKPAFPRPDRNEPSLRQQ